MSGGGSDLPTRRDARDVVWSASFAPPVRPHPPLSPCASRPPGEPSSACRGETQPLNEDPQLLLELPTLTKFPPPGGLQLLSEIGHDLGVDGRDGEGSGGTCRWKGEEPPGWESGFCRAQLGWEWY